MNHENFELSVSPRRESWQAIDLPMARTGVNWIELSEDHACAFRRNAVQFPWSVAELLLELVSSSPREHRSRLICGGKPSQNLPVITCAILYFAMASPQRMREGRILLKLSAVFQPSRGHGHGCGSLFPTDLRVQVNLAFSHSLKECPGDLVQGESDSLTPLMTSLLGDHAAHSSILVQNGRTIGHPQAH